MNIVFDAFLVKFFEVNKKIAGGPKRLPSLTQFFQFRIFSSKEIEARLEFFFLYWKIFWEKDFLRKSDILSTFLCGIL